MRLTGLRASLQNPATQNRTRDHLIAAVLYSQMLYQLGYSRLVAAIGLFPGQRVRSPEKKLVLPKQKGSFSGNECVVLILLIFERGLKT